MCFGVPGCFGALRARFQAGSFTTDGTIREFGVYRGWFSVYGVNLPRGESISRKVRGPERNLPRYGHESRMVRASGGEPSTVEVDFMEGSGSRAEPSTLGVNITDGAESKAEPSTQRADIAEGSDTRGRTVHVGGMYRGRFGYQWLNHPR